MEAHRRGMTNREKTLTVKLTEDELRKAHAIADAGDESIGRYLRRVIAHDYERRFGDAAPPNVTFKPGPHPKKKTKAAK
jgi:hypothetical protein